ncbi:DUF4364 family protein [Anaerocolumna sp. AGMB13020]|uniref:DUF4364 family protein n=1 Tax=Anaerocolumna sp. AGMB13020 TaxID=3081750 RepID=UPI0029554462|nr:DUF4364 family protein [Anaerocolumna sp. AGMB13020]WOO38778.1 DUF4364 family protein [Anaerocolumna sp. AGMB13020]
MQTDALTLYKLIILFLLDKVDFPLTNAQISNFILDKEYTNYFSLQQCISELTEEEFMTVQTVGHSSLYQITPSGEETLSFFQNMISSAIQEEIVSYLKENKYSLRDESSILSEYHKTGKDEYTVSLRVMEKKNPIIDINLAVPTEEDASKICRNWRGQSQEIYSYVLSSLLKE